MSSNFIKVTPLNPAAFSLLFFGMHGVFFTIFKVYFIQKSNKGRKHNEH